MDRNCKDLNECKNGMYPDKCKSCDGKNNFEPKEDKDNETSN